MKNKYINGYTVTAAIIVITALLFFSANDEPNDSADNILNNNSSNSPTFVAGQASETANAFPAASKESRPIVAGPHKSHDPHSSLTAEKHIQVALQHKQEGRMFEAIQSLSMAIAKYSDNVDLYAVRASLYMEQGKPAAALQDL